MYTAEGATPQCSSTSRSRTPVQRDTVYNIVARFDDPALDPPSLEPREKVALSGPTRWRLREKRNRRNLAVEPSEKAAAGEAVG